MALEKFITKDEFDGVLKSDGRSALANESLLNIAKENIDKLDFPTRKQEEWRYTSIKRLLNHQYSLATAKEIDQKTVDTFSIHGFKGLKLVFVNGFFIEEFSDIKQDGLIVKNMSAAVKDHADIVDQHLNTTELSENNLFSAANTAYSSEGAFVYVPKSTVADQSIQIINLTDGHGKQTISQVRNLVVVEDNSQVEIIHTYHSLSVGYTLMNTATEIFVGENANVSYSIFEGEGNDAFHMNHVNVVQKANSHFKSNTVTLCGALVRNDLRVILDGDNCETDLNGLYLPDRDQHVANNVYVEHAKTHGVSHQLYKGINDNTASSVFVGKIYVAEDAQKTDAYQSNKNVLISEDAKAVSKPQLEIYADDVSCTHGSTTGQLDEEALFFMQARGIGKETARMLLLKAFVIDVIETIENDAYKNMVHRLVEVRLSGEKT